MIFWISKITYPGIHQHYKFLFRSILHSRHIYIFPLRRCLFVRSISQLIHKHRYLIYKHRNFQGNQNRWNILESYNFGGHHRKFIDIKYCHLRILQWINTQYIPMHFPSAKHNRPLSQLPWVVPSPVFPSTVHASANVIKQLKVFKIMLLTAYKLECTIVQS